MPCYQRGCAIFGFLKALARRFHVSDTRITDPGAHLASAIRGFQEANSTEELHTIYASAREHIRAMPELKNDLEAAYAFSIQRVIKSSRGTRTVSRMMTGGAQYGIAGGWSQDRIEMVQHYRNWVYIAIQAMNDKLGEVRPNIGTEVEKPTSASKAFRCRLNKAMGSVQPGDEIEPVGADHPLRRLLENPNEPDTRFDLWAEINIFLQLTGNAYIWAVPDALFGLPCELWVIPSHWVWPRIGRDRLIECYEIRPWGGAGGMFRFPPEEMIHIRKKSPIHKIDGYSPLAAGSRWIDTGESIDASRWSTFKNGAFPSIGVELSESYGDPTQQELERIYAKFFNRVRGEHRAGAPLVAPPGAKFMPLSFSPSEMAYVQSADQIRDWVLSLFRVPKVVVGITEAMTYGSVLGAQAAFCSFCINPMLSFLGQVLTEQLAHRFDKRLRVWWDDCTPQDPVQLNADLQTDFAAGTITTNEWRAARGRAPYKKGGNNPLLPMGLAPYPFNEDEDFDLFTPTAGTPETIDPIGEEPSLEPILSLERILDIKSSKVPADLLSVPDIRQEAAFACGAACMRAVAKFYGVEAEDTETAFIELLGTDADHGTAVEELVKGTEKLGLKATLFKEDDFTRLGEALKAGSPVILPIQFGGVEESRKRKAEGHYVTAVGLTNKSVYVMDPVVGLRRIGRKKFLGLWTDKDTDAEYIRSGIVVSRKAKGALVRVPAGW